MAIFKLKLPGGQGAIVLLCARDWLNKTAKVRMKRNNRLLKVILQLFDIGISTYSFSINFGK